MRKIAINQKVITFGNSKLTRILEDVLAQGTQLCWIGTLSQKGEDIDATLATLEFMNSIKGAKVNVVKTQKVSAKEQLKEEIQISSIYKELLTEALKMVSLPKEIISTTLVKYGKGPSLMEEMHSMNNHEENPKGKITWTSRPAALQKKKARKAKRVSSYHL